MKKSLIYAVISGLLLSSTMAFAETTQQLPQQPKQECKKVMKKQRPHKINLDERLKLTEEQKKQAHDIRMDGHKKIKPVMEKIKAKKMEAKAINEDANLSAEAKAQKLAPIKADIRKLKQEARKIRQENTKEFEAILTPEQKAEFEKIKQEGREKFKKQHQKGKYNKQKHNNKGCSNCKKLQK